MIGIYIWAERSAPRRVGIREAIQPPFELAPIGIISVLELGHKIVLIDRNTSVTICILPGDPRRTNIARIFGKRRNIWSKARLETAPCRGIRATCPIRLRGVLPISFYIHFKRNAY